METLKQLYYRLQHSSFLQSRLLGNLIKIAIISAVSFSIYFRVIAKNNVQELWQAVLSQLSFPNLYWFLFALVFIPTIILLEAFNWHLLIRRIIPDITWKKIIKAIFAGYSVAIFTPNGIGKVTGTILVIQAKSRIELLATTYISELAKQIVMSVMGVFGLLYGFNRFFELNDFLQSITLPVGVLVSILLILLFFNIRYLERLVQRIPFLKKYHYHFSAFGEYNRLVLAKIIVVTTIRYGLMVTQYFILLRFLGIEVPFAESFLTVALIMILRAYFPLPPSLGILMRVELALYFWGQYTDNEISILATTFSLWILNIVVPALIGMVLIGNTNITKTLFGQKN